jgi:hypothetical protein
LVTKRSVKAKTDVQPVGLAVAIGVALTLIAVDRLMAILSGVIAGQWPRRCHW